MRRALFVALALCSSGLGGCKKSSQVVVGLLTDIAVPTTLTSATLEAYRDGVQVDDELFSPLATAPGQPFELPGSFDFFSPSGGTPLVQLVLTGFDPTEKQIVVRTATVQYASEEVSFYRMALVQACIGVTCATGQTCREGTCVSDSVTDLPRYDKALVDEVQCNSGETFIDTSTCSSGCQPLPVTGTCAAGQTCIEGTCYSP